MFLQALGDSSAFRSFLCGFLLRRSLLRRVRTIFRQQLPRSEDRLDPAGEGARKNRDQVLHGPALADLVLLLLKLTTRIAIL